jgi:hypothetical protein
MSSRRQKSGRWRRPCPGSPPVGPQLDMILRGEELLERAHSLGARIDERVRQAISPGEPDSAQGQSVPAQAAKSAAVLATRLLGRLLRESP